ncbi:acetyl-CoA C-acetyltransferase [Thalassobacillus cyri]|uniref:acetyl-CoA C-acetyltransferase n=1 Tax=Thalassobacillus cyri TaxID=571932 RepID=A0A1H4GZD9_9BACI|nr:thiolase family protein [Thalassobacillus cyri]SEB14711.1 acetyl-CoA C-acetyltransferase [Thalassobacillus cyri]
MKESIVIVEAVRTPVGRYGGILKDINSGELASIVIEAALSRTGLSPELIDEVILGEVRQTTESSNVARVAALRAGVPESSPAFTINRLCASGMQAVASGVQQIISDQAEVVIAGGTESLSNAPIYLRNSRFGGDRTKLVDSNLEAGQQPVEMYGKNLGMGMTAENVAERYSISREDQDAFALDSQRKAAEAIEKNAFQEEIAPVEVRQKKQTKTFDKDEHPRPQTTLEKLNQLKPVFKEGGSVTAGNACGRNDGAAALVIMKEEKAKELNLKPLARITDWTATGVSPEVMGVGPVPAVHKLLERTDRKLDDIGRIELNEAFASQSLAVIRELGLDPKKVNVNGGAIALGHPLGATGARLLTTLVHEMKRSGEKTGLATLCVGGGQGMAMLLDRM